MSQADIAQAFAARFTAPPPSFDGDLAQTQPAFLNWYGSQPGDVQQDLQDFWTNQALTAAEIQQLDQNGGYARMAMLIGYAMQVWGYAAP